MHLKSDTDNKLDLFKWLLVLAIFACAIWANFYYTTSPLYIKLLVGLLVFAVSAAIALQTTLGKNIWGALDEARAEIKKVVWPTREETVKSTGVVILVVVIIACFLWLLDSVLSKLAKLFIG